VKQPKDEDRIIFFYDGHCPFCRSVARHYRKAKGHEQVLFINIHNEEKFNAYRKGLSKTEAEKAIHARLPSGEMRIGVDALITLWDTFPNYRIFAKIFDHKATKPIAQVFYRVIAKYRKKIPSFLIRS
jgi:predicted DCC family thiol-disulfide oxidoreductase YuxK